MAGNFFDHSFSPRWTSPRVHHRSSHGEEGHHRMNLETLSRFLHAFQSTPETGATARSPDFPKVHPSFDLIEGPEDFKIYGDLPGLTSDDIHVDVNDHLFTVTISGEFVIPGEIATLQDAVAITHRDAGKPGTNVEKGKEETTKPEARTGEVAAESSEPKEGEKPVEKTEAEPAPEAPKEEAEKEEKEEEEKKKGEKEEDTGEEKEVKIKYHIQERKLGRFKREFQFPVEVVIMDGVKAQCKHGLLSITVPKHPTPPEERKKGRKLDVE